MTRADYDLWSERHATLFGFSFESDCAMLDSWYEVFCDFTRDELEEATTALAKSVAAPKQLRDHRHVLVNRLHEKRAVVFQKQLVETEDRGTCSMCSGTGSVVVPHLAGVKDGEWFPLKVARGGAHYYTCDVSCFCALGNWLRGQQGPHTSKGMQRGTKLTIAVYETRNPGWRQQLAKREAAGRAESRIDAGPPEWQEQAQRLMDQYGVRDAGVEDDASQEHN